MSMATPVGDCPLSCEHLNVSVPCDGLPPLALIDASHRPGLLSGRRRLPEHEDATHDERHQLQPLGPLLLHWHNLPFRMVALGLGPLGVTHEREKSEIRSTYTALTVRSGTYRVNPVE